MKEKIKVYVGMSGGVDSSLAAALLVEQGYDVTGVFMKNWTADLPGMTCPWAEDLADAKRVAVGLGVDFKVFDFEKEYKDKVVDYMIDEYKNGRTPNPDIMCNQEVKFKLFLETALADGADMIATGHYARVSRQGFVDSLITSSSLLHAGLNQGPGALLNSDSRVSDEVTSKPTNQSDSSNILSGHLQPEFEKALGPLSDPARSRSEEMLDEALTKTGILKQAIDANKDQTYFLYRVTGEAMAKTLFPVGEFTKPQVRKMADERGLTTAVKKDSQGICFIGQIGIRDFISQYVDAKPGNIVDKKTGKILGQHDGAVFYTFGQRHGLDLGGGMPYYVVGKDMNKNEVYVTTNLNDDTLWRKTINLTDLHWINDAPGDGKYEIRVRHRAPLVGAVISLGDDSTLKLTLDNPERAIAPGQSVVIYDGDICLGGGIIV